MRDGRTGDRLALAGAEEGDLTDAQWAEIAQDFMDEMGFTEASGRAPAQWVAIRHGHSKAGNDHIHIAASMVRKDGTKWSSWRDFPRAQQAACGARPAPDRGLR